MVIVLYRLLKQLISRSVALPAIAVNLVLQIDGPTVYVNGLALHKRDASLHILFALSSVNARRL
jgi:hypothetical protein